VILPVCGETPLWTASVPHSLAARSDPAAGDSPFAQLDSNLLLLCKAAFAHHQAGQFAEAARLYVQILARNSALPEIHNNLGHALIMLGKPAPAAAACQRASELKRDYPEAFCNWGLALAALERFDEAEAKYRQAIRISPRFAGAYNNLGIVLKDKGRLTEAERAFETAIDLEPNGFSYYDNLAAVRPFAADDTYFATLEAAAENFAAFSISQQMHLHFALAKAYDGLGRPERASPHLLDANRLKRQQITYNEADMLSLMHRLRTLISRDFIQARQGYGTLSTTPIFIVGMPRSGTTLIEQVLASHPQISGAGELPLLDQVAGAARRLLPGIPHFPEMMSDMSPADFRAVGELYVETISQRAPTATHIVDKMTVNFLLVGLIHLAMPNATIIHAVRNPVDTCLSCFSMHFTSGHEHTYDLAELGRYYRHYRELMAHWHDVLPPGRIMDVHYEELVADLEGVAQGMVSHCGLAWNDRCLDFHRNERPINTASAVQVRKPIYRDSIGRWRKYEPMLGPLLAELGTCVAPSASAVLPQRASARRG
jgi:tetratricopeptide (TPR) repeat protein